MSCTFISHSLSMHFVQHLRPVSLHAGYLTPPGAGAYWGDCWYPLYVAYIVCNGFALVFAVAAIVAVLVGPIVLVCLDRKTWREQIAILAIIHLVLSLLSFVAAFALTGFLTASVDAPAFNCGNLKCADGGVPCSAYTLKRNGDIYARYDQTSKLFQEVGISADMADTSSTIRFQNQTRPRFEMLLNPVIVQLNNKTFANNRSGEILGADVICRDYRYLAQNNFSDGPPDGPPAFRELKDTREQNVTNSCLVLLDANFNSTFQSDPQGSARLGWRAFKPNAHTLWCSTNMSSLGPGYLPLTLRTALKLMASGAPEALLDTRYQDFLEISRAPELYVLSEGGGMRCPNFSINTHTAIGDLWRGPQANMTAIELISEDDNAWGWNGDAKYDYPGDHVSCNSDGQSEKFDRVFFYADSLGWDRSGVLFRPSRSGEYVDSALCQDRSLNISRTNNFPLQGAKLYASLQYQCSGLDKGVLCDFGVSPPLAVSPDGTYLNRKNIPDLPDVVIFGSPQTAASVAWAVWGMVIAVIVANIMSGVFLVCWPRLEGWTKRARDWFRDLLSSHWHVQ